jgi:hypothetical protein
MKKAVVVLVVTALATCLFAADISLTISPVGSGNWQIVASGIPNELSHQTVYVLQSTADFVTWTGVVTNTGLIPPWITNTVYSTNVVAFYRASITYQPDQ